MRGKKIVISSSVSLLYEFINIICMFIVPRIILVNFGSSYNGLTSSILQFLNCIILFRAGIAAVTRFALYQPLANNDEEKISSIIATTSIFMKKVVTIFSIIVILIAFIYPFIVIKEFKWTYTFSLILIMGLGILIQNYFSITYQILLIADQKTYIYSVIQIITLVLNTIATLFLVKYQSIHILKLGGIIIYLLNPILINLYVKKNYNINKNAIIDFDLISKRWDAFAQEIASFINNNTDLVILTIFTTTKEISVYTVYYMVVNGIKTIIVSLVNGFSAALGNMIARDEQKNLIEGLKLYEFVVYMIATIAFSSTLVLIIPFIELYTAGIEDVNYTRYLFATIICLCNFFICIRLPYIDLVEITGGFKETKKGAMIEAIINLTISVLCVKQFGLIGVTFGTLFAAVFRTVQYVVYVSKQVIKRSVIVVLKKIGICMLQCFTNILLIEIFPVFPIKNYFDFFVYGSIIFLVFSGIGFMYSKIFYQEELRSVLKKLKSLLKKKSVK